MDHQPDPIDNDGFDSPEECSERMSAFPQWNKRKTLAVLLSALIIEKESKRVKSENKTTRRSNIKRGPIRDHVLEFISTWSDDMFYRQFRMTREEFIELREALKPIIKARDIEMAKRSSGSAIPLEIKILITLRMLSGASYLELIHYGICIDHYEDYFFEVLEAMDKCQLLNNINMPKNETELAEVNEGWTSLQERKLGDIPFKHIFAAGDGLVIAVRPPTETELHQRKLSRGDFFNRKGFFGLIVQAFCDHVGRFLYWEISWPGSTHDITAYNQTNFLHQLMHNPLYKNSYVAVDEAYQSLSDKHHLCPYSKNQIGKVRSEHGEAEVEKLLCYNNRLSRLRITIERAFGMYMRKWGIFWKPLAFSVGRNILIARVCAKLHNQGLDKWASRESTSLSSNDQYLDGATMNNSAIAEIQPLAVQPQTDSEIIALRGNDENVEDNLDNFIRGRARENSTRDEIKDSLFNMGFRFLNRSS